MTGFFKIPFPHNEVVKGYAPQSIEKKELIEQYIALKKQDAQVPMYIGAEKVFTAKKNKIVMPHDHQHVLGHYQVADKSHVEKAISAALAAKKKWANLHWESRAAIFLKAAELISGKYRAKINAATMLCQSKNVFQAEIDAVCELADFLRFNVYYMSQIYADQPIVNSPGIWNRMEHRPLEGFIYAITPFNFTAIAGNLAAAPAMLGNVIVWKPSDSQMLSANVIMEIFQEAGLPNGVINMVTGDPQMITDTVLEHAEFSGLHYTGSTHIFKNIWGKIGTNLTKYKNYPRIVGETGGKDFVLVHPSAPVSEVVVGLIRGAFEYQGQKCSAASRAYLPKSLFQAIRAELIQELGTLKMGSPEDTSHFINAVIHQGSFDKIKGYIERAKASHDSEIIFGGKCDDTKGYFVEPTVILTSNPKYSSMCEEIFGPVLTIYVYEDEKWAETLKLIDETSNYALTGCVFSKSRAAIEEAMEVLQYAAGNFYINDKPTGAVVGQQAFGGARASGTNDKAGSILNLLRWVSPRTIKETLVPPSDYRYPFLG